MQSTIEVKRAEREKRTKHLERATKQKETSGLKRVKVIE